MVGGAAKACTRSTLMLSGMVGLSKVGLCLWLRTTGVSIRGWTILFVSCISVLSTLVESQTKVGEMSLYILPRFLDAMWNFLKRRRLVIEVPGGRTLLFSTAMSVMAYCHEHEVKDI